MTEAHSADAGPVVAGPVGIVGLGLIGGSIARALGRLPDPPTVLASSRDAADLEVAREERVVEQGFLEPDTVLEESKTLILALPLGPLLELLHEHGGRLTRKDLVMDVASLKAPVLRVAQGAGLARRFVGSHPMAGGETSGFGAARTDLFKGAVVWLAERGAEAGVKEGAVTFWRSVGAVPEWADPEQHDRKMAWCSHLPQLVANALAGAIDAAGYRVEDLGPGGRDMVRLAGSSPDMWRDLLERSAPAVGTGVESVARALQVLADLLARREMDSVAGFMETTRRWRGEEPWS